jgi:hypothetical protein
MASVEVEYSVAALSLREELNIGQVVLLPVVVFLCVRFIYTKWVEIGRVYKRLGRPVKGLIGLAVWAGGDWIRALTIWIILHTLGSSGSYLTDIVPLVISLIVTTAGLLCFIRNFTPEVDQYNRPLWWGGHRLWVSSLAVYIIVSVGNWTVV